VAAAPEAASAVPEAKARVMIVMKYFIRYVVAGTKMILGAVVIV
jgi:hypothetical protein